MCTEMFYMYTKWEQ